MQNAFGSTGQGQHLTVYACITYFFIPNLVLTPDTVYQFDYLTDITLIIFLCYRMLYRLKLNCCTIGPIQVSSIQTESKLCFLFLIYFIEEYTYGENYNECIFFNYL